MEKALEMAVLLTVIVFVLMLFFLVICHELGHFLASRKAGIVIEEFGIGLWWRIFAVKRGDTTYSVNLIPVGAFVRPVGEDDPSVEGGLASKGPLTRMAVYAAGPLVNIVLALVFITAFFMGVTTTQISGNQGVIVHSVAAGSVAEQAGLQAGDVIVTVDGAPMADLGDVGDAVNVDPQVPKSIVIQREGVKLPPVSVLPEYNQEHDRYVLGVSISSWLDTVTGVEAGSPLAGAVQPGDTVLQVDGEWVYDRESFSQALEAASSGEEEEFTLLMERIKEDGTLEDFEVKVAAGSVSGGALAGVGVQWVEGAALTEERRSPWEALGESWDFVIHLPSLIKESLPLVRDNPGSALVGPVGAAQLTVEVVKVGGMASVLFLGGFISISLALFNFLPIPPLDGGGILIAAIEGLRGGVRPFLDVLRRRGSVTAVIEGLRRGQRLPQQAVRFVYLVGTVLMVMLFVGVFYSDISRIISGEGFAGL